MGNKPPTWAPLRKTDFATFAAALISGEIAAVLLWAFDLGLLDVLPVGCCIIFCYSIPLGGCKPALS